jgi:hypothetical protein
MAMTPEDVGAVLGPTDEPLVSDLIRTGATREELAEAWAWVNSDEALLNEGRRPPSGRVAQLVDLLAVADEEDDA